MEIKFEIIEDLNLENLGPESIHAMLSLKEQVEFKCVVFVNDLYMKFAEWLALNDRTSFLFEDSLEFETVFEIKQISEQKYQFLGFDGTMFLIDEINVFCTKFMDSIVKAFEVKGEKGIKYYHELQKLRVY